MTFKKQLKFMGLRIGAFVADTVLRYDEKAEDASERKSLSMQGRVSLSSIMSRPKIHINLGDLLLSLSHTAQLQITNNRCSRSKPEQI
jgi:hypothetical protein